ncbi:hypothetical protein TNCV_1782411 [Trichonephila clavipes]|nr:hypothetical protein TNCV_1782411 [Trichonephila clavipes]
MAAEWAGCVSSQTKPVWMYTPKKSSPVVRQKGATASALYIYLGVGPTSARVSHGFPWLLVVWGHDNIFVKECGNSALCCSESQGDFRFLRGVLYPLERTLFASSTNPLKNQRRVTALVHSFWKPGKSDDAPGIYVSNDPLPGVRPFGIPNGGTIQPLSDGKIKPIPPN